MFKRSWFYFLYKAEYDIRKMIKSRKDKDQRTIK